MVNMLPIGPEHAPTIEVEESDHILLLIDIQDMKRFQETAEHGEERVHDWKTQSKDGDQYGNGRGPF